MTEPDRSTTFGQELQRKLEFEFANAGLPYAPPSAPFITFEGGEGSGKTTQAEHLKRRLRVAEIPALFVREPGTTKLGEYVRHWVKRWSDTGPLAETLLFQAARAHLVEGVIRPTLAQGTVVICDRFTDSTMAYQGYGRGLKLDTVACLNDMATGGLKPSLTIFMKLPPETGLARLNQPDFTAPMLDPAFQRTDPEHELRFEQATIDFHRRVLKGYEKLAQSDPSRWLVVDATRNEESIADEIWNRVSDLVHVK